jgi:hypothetical protein
MRLLESGICLMPRFARRAFRSVQRRRYCAGLTLVAYLATAFGVPMPAEAGAAHGGAACGCATIATCEGGQCCCSGHAAPANGATPTQSVLPMNSAGHACCTTPAKDALPDADNEHHSATGIRWVIGIAALECRGHSTLWVSAGLVLPAAPPVAWRPLLTFAGRLPTSDPIVYAATLIPPDPPPR